MRSDSVELGLKEGWALYDRPTPKALAGKARNYAKELFEAGQAKSQRSGDPGVRRGEDDAEVPYRGGVLALS